MKAYPESRPAEIESDYQSSDFVPSDRSPKSARKENRPLVLKEMVEIPWDYQIYEDPKVPSLKSLAPNSGRSSVRGVAMTDALIFG